MELKKYFGKFGIGWVVLGLILSILPIILLSLAWKGISLYRVIGEVIGISIFIFALFLVGFVGLTRIFISVLVLILLVWILLMMGGGAGGWEILFVVPAIGVGLVVGIIWEVIHHIRLKKRQSQL